MDHGRVKPTGIATAPPPPKAGTGTASVAFQSKSTSRQPAAQLGLLSQLLSLLRPIASFNAGLARCLAVLALLVAASGYTSLAAVYATRYITSLPPMQTAPLHFDYSGSVATATVDLRSQLAPFPKPLGQYFFPRLTEDPLYLQLALQEGSQPQSSSEQTTKAQQQQQQLPTCSIEEPLVELPRWHALDASPSGRILSPSQQVHISVELQLPSSHTDLFQVSGELLSGNGEVLERQVRTHVALVMPVYWRILRQLVLAPCYIAGACSDHVTLRFDLFDYVEREDPVLGFRAVLSSRRSAAGRLPPPPVSAASLRIKLRMSMLHTFLYWVRPSLATTLVLVPMAAALALTASAFALGLTFASVLLSHVARSLPGSQLPTAAPAVGQLPPDTSLSQDASSASKSFTSSAQDATGSVVGGGGLGDDDGEEEDEEGEERQGKGERGRSSGREGQHVSDAETADVAWQNEDEEQFEDLGDSDQEFHETGETWP